MKKWKRLKRIVAFTLAVILAGTTVDLSTFAVSAAEGLEGAACAESGCAGTYSNGFCSANSTHYQAAVLNESSAYEISNAGQLYWFAEHVNTAAANSGDNAILTKDIVVNEKVLNADGTLVSNSGSLRTWTPVGTAAYPYRGTFRGNGFSISGLYCVQPEENGEAGLFAYIQQANLMDIIILDSRFAAEEKGGVAGAIAAISIDSLIQDCYSEASVTAGQKAGGIVGASLDDTLIGCGNAGTVTASDKLDYLGGVLGATQSISGENASSVTSCFNIGTVVNAAGDAFYTGALVGYPEWLFLYNSYYDSSKCSKATGNTVDYTNRTEFEDCTIADVTAKEHSEFASGAVCELIKDHVSTWTYTAGEHTALCRVCGAVEQKDHHNLHSSCDNGGDCTVCGYTIQPGAHYYSDDTCLICNWPCPGHTFGDDNNCTTCDHQLVPVTDIQFERHNASQTAVQGEKLNLTSGVTVLPENADFKQVTWYKVDGTEETAIATTDYASYSAAEAGTLKLRAKIENGAGMGTAYVKDFTFTITPVSYKYDILKSPVVISSDGGSNISITYNGTEVVVSSDTAIRVYGDGETVAANNITIKEGADVNLILDNCTITGTNNYAISPIEIASGASASITLVGSNQLTGGYLMPGIYVPQGAAVIIGGTGSLDVAGNEDGSAAIGGSARSNRYSSGSITINSGTIHAESASEDAAIGAGSGGDMGDITINGGNITAVNTNSAVGGAGIGVAYNSKTLGKITINGGRITATGGEGAAGIGSGFDQTAPDIEITGGTIQATGKGTYGIGPGNRGTGSTVTITGGNVSSSVGGTVNNGSTSLYTITLKTANNASVETVITKLAGSESEISYGFVDVTPINNKLYFYLPSGSQPTSVVSDGVKYIGTVTNNAGTFVYEHTCVATVTEATCKTLAVCDVCGLPTGNLNPDNHESDSYTYTAHETYPAVLHIVKHACCSAVKETAPHTKKNGICTDCGAADLTADENGIYQIYTAEDLMVFAKFVNNGNTTANAKLMADINLEGYDWKPIGTYSDSDTTANAAYSGTFDGNYHLIKNLSVKVETAHETGLFGRVNGGGTIKNLGVVDATVENTQGIRAGVIAGEIHNSTVTNVFTAGNITVTTSNANGQAGGIAGECANSVLANCYTTYGYLTSTVGTLNNCYYMADAANSASKGTNLPKSSFTSGELTYILNGRSAEGVWKQTLDTDEYPGFTGETVYAVSETCDESTITSYSNNADEVIPHSFGKDGICTVCGALEPAKYVDGVYEISNVGQYMWFAKLVNAGNADVNAKLMDDIDMTDYQATYGNVMIGTSAMKYSGTFDGNGKILTVNLNSTEEYTAPFRYINGSTIQNLTVNGTISANQKFAAGLVGYSEGASRIEKCMVAVTINSSVSGDGTHGGLVANVNSGSLTIDNCGFIGSITGDATNSCGGFVGWANGTTTISNSYVAGTFTTGTSSCYTFGRNPGKITVSNSYYKTAYGTNNSGATQMTQAQFESGEVTYKLNNGVTDSTQAWGQTLTGDGADAYPVLGGDKVYYGYVSCTAAAEKVYTNDSNASDTKVHTDADGDGKCDVETCGVFVDGIGARLAGYTLSLDGNIGVNFYMELDAEVANDTSAYMLFTLPGGGTQTVLVSQATKNTTLTAGKTYYVFSCKVAAKEMTDTIKAQMICSDGNGGTKAGTEYTYSVREYAEALIGRAGATEKEIALAKAMLNYGAYAQTYFNYKTDTLANVGYEDNALTISGDAMTTLKNYVPEVNVTEGSALTYAGSTIRLESELKVRHYFKLAEGATEPSGLTLYVPPAEYADKITDTYYYYESDGIAFGSWGTKTAYSEVAGNTITYCPLSYVTTVVATKADSDLSGETSLQNLMKALYLYYQSVVSYNAN